MIFRTSKYFLDELLTWNWCLVPCMKGMNMKSSFMLFCYLCWRNRKNQLHFWMKWYQQFYFENRTLNRIHQIHIQAKGLLYEKRTKLHNNEKKFITYRITFIITFFPLRFLYDATTILLRLLPAMLHQKMDSLLVSMEQITWFPDVYLFCFVSGWKL